MLTTIQSSDVYITQETLQHIGISPMEQHIDVEEGRVIVIKASEYVGEYEVTPTSECQILNTTEKNMARDVIINPIPSNYGRIIWNGSELAVV